MNFLQKLVLAALWFWAGGEPLGSASRDREEHRRSRNLAASTGADLASWILGPLLGILFLFWLGSGGGVPLAVGFKLALSIFTIVKVGSVLLLVLLVFSAIAHPADTVVRKVARLVLFLGIVSFWLMQWTTSHPKTRHA